MKKRGSSNGIRCPHCGSAAHVRTSRSLTPLYREQVYQCQNHLCGHVYLVGLEVLRTISPSATPRPDMRIPFSPNVDRDLVKTTIG